MTKSYIILARKKNIGKEDVNDKATMKTQNFIKKHVGKYKTSYHVRVPLGVNPATGRYQYYKKSFDSLVEAKAAVKEVLNNKKEYMLKSEPEAKSSDASLTTGEAMLKWLDMRKSNLAPLTLEEYRIIIGKHLIPAFGEIPLEQLKPEHIQNYYLEALHFGRKDGKPGGLSPVTVTHHHRVLREILNQAVKWRLIPYNPADAVVPPGREAVKDLHNKGVLTMEQLHLVINSLKGTYLYLPVFIAGFTGMRRSEVLGLTWENVDLERAILYVVQTLYQRKKDVWFFQPTKNNSSRRAIELYDFTVEELKKYQPSKNKGLVCLTDDGHHINPGTLGARYIAETKKLGLRTNFHALRHTHATLLLQMGVPPKIVAERLGHSSTRTTEDIYAHVLPGIQRGAAKLFEEKFIMLNPT